MNLILVDPYAKRVYPVDVGRELTLETIYQLIDCDDFEVHQLFCAKKHHAFYCDGQGTFKRPPLPALLLDGYEYPVYGRLLVFKAIGDKETSPTISVSEVFSLVFFLP